MLIHPIQPIRGLLSTDPGADCSLCATPNGKCTARQPRLGKKATAQPRKASKGVQGVQKGSRRSNITSPCQTATQSRSPTTATSCLDCLRIRPYTANEPPKARVCYRSCSYPDWMPVMLRLTFRISSDSWSFPRPFSPCVSSRCAFDRSRIATANLHVAQFVIASKHSPRHPSDVPRHI